MCLCARGCVCVCVFFFFFCVVFRGLGMIFEFGDWTVFRTCRPVEFSVVRLCRGF